MHIKLNKYITYVYFLKFKYKLVIKVQNLNGRLIDQDH